MQFNAPQYKFFLHLRFFLIPQKSVISVWEAVMDVYDSFDYTSSTSEN